MTIDVYKRQHYMYPIYPFNWHALRALLIRRPIAPDNT